MLLIPVPGEVVQRSFDLLGGSSLVDRPQILCHLVAVLPGDLGQAVAHHVDDAELHLGPGIHRLYGLGEAGEAVAAGDEDVGDAPVIQFGQDVEPELRAFVPLDLKTQEFLFAL